MLFRSSAALFSLVAYIGTSLFLTQRYTCSATFVVSPRNSTTAYQSSSAITNTTTAQFASLLSGSPLVSRVKRLCGSDVQGATVSTSVVKDTNLIQLKTYGPSPRSAYYMCVGILVDRGVHVAVRLSQRLFAVHHAAAGLLTKSLYVLCGKCL